MKHTKLITVLLLVMCMFTALYGCMRSSYRDETDVGSSQSEHAKEETSINSSLRADTEQEDDSSGAQEDVRDKIVRTFDLRAETKTFDDAVKAVEERVNALGGYMESAEVEGGTSYSGRNSERTASFVIRIPAGKTDEFLSGIGDGMNIISTKESAENVSEVYYDLKARSETLEAKRKALEEMLLNTENLSDYMLINDELYKVIQEIESYESRLKYYDSKVNYSTVNLTVYEVVEYTPSAKPGFGVRLGRAFTNGWKDFGVFCREFFIVLVRLMPLLLIAGVIVVFVIWNNKRIRRKKIEAARRAQEAQAAGQETGNGSPSR